MNRSRPFLSIWTLALVALATAAGGGLASGPGCCCDGVCPLGPAMAKMGIDCSMDAAAGCSLERVPKAPAPGSHGRDALQPGVLWTAAVLLPPGAADRAAAPAAPALPSVVDRPEIPPPRSS